MDIFVVNYAFFGYSFKHTLHIKWEVKVASFLIKFDYPNRTEETCKPNLLKKIT